MATNLIFIDGVDYYASPDITKKWSTGSGTVNTTGGRNGGGALVPTGLHTKVFSAVPGWVFGFAFKASSFGTGNLVSFIDGGSAGTAQVALRINATGRLEVRRGSVVIGTGSAVLTLDTWHYIEFGALVDNIGGTVLVRLNGLDEIDVTTNTQATGNATADTLGIQASGTGNLFDDMYLRIGTGPIDDGEMYGDSRVQTLRPNGDGDSSQWSPNSGTTHWDKVDDPTPDGDFTIVAAGSAGLLDLFTMENFATAPSAIHGVQVSAVYRKTADSTVSVRPVLRHSTTNYEGSIVAASLDWQMLRQMYAINPGTSAPWSASDVNGLEVGIKREA